MEQNGHALHAVSRAQRGNLAIEAHAGIGACAQRAIAVNADYHKRTSRRCATGSGIDAYDAAAAADSMPIMSSRMRAAAATAYAICNRSAAVATRESKQPTPIIAIRCC
jgi:hypothetical protein